MVQKNIDFKRPFRTYQYKKMPDISIFASKQFSDLRLRFKKTAKNEQKEKKKQKTDAEDIKEEYKSVLIDGYCDDCLRVYTCGLLNCDKFREFKNSSD